MTDYSKLLNPEQCEAATAGDGPVLVLAAAGTGKTRTLVHRVSYLMERGVDPRSVLLLTFTNRAANEMIARARQLVGDSVGTMLSGTFHHICNRFLHHFAERIDYRRDFTILDRDDSRSLIGNCIGDCVADKKSFPKKDVVASFIGRSANSRISVEELAADSDEEIKLFAKDMGRVAARYAERKRELGAMDFDDLLVNGLRLLKDCPDVLSFYQEKFQHVLVDEYQDTNLLQAEMVDLLAAKHRNLMVVGDDFQCIYSWRGANFKNIMEFPRRWPDCRIVKLERNYRSVPSVLDVANACIRGNPEQFQKTLRPVRGPGEKPRLYKLRDADEQVATVTGLIARYLREGRRPSDIAVLYRAHFHSIELQMQLARAHIPYTITSGTGVFEQAHTKDVVSFLRICEYPRDEMAFLRFMSLFDGMGEKTVAKLWEKLGHSFDARSPESRKALSEALRPKPRGQFAPILELFAAYHEGQLWKDGNAVVQRLCDVFYADYLKKKYENAADREDDVRELGHYIEKQEGGIPAFLQEVALLTNIDTAYDPNEPPPETIHLSTVHQAKGLEWPVVFIIWASEGMFPSSKGAADGDLSEERRLFYVAVTRAKDELTICSPSQRYSRDGGVFFCKPSPFITELPRGLLREHYGWHAY